MMHISEITAPMIKAHIQPEWFYPKYLNGNFGKSSNNGWFQWKGLCPFHDDKHAGSLYINKDTGAFKCFSCGAGGGDIIALQMMLRRQSFPEALKELGRSILCVQ